MSDILHRIGIQSTPDKIFHALTTRDGLAAWWTRDTQIDKEGALRFRFRGDHGVEIGGFDMKVLELHPSARVVWAVLDGPAEWIGTKIDWEIKQSGDWVIVLFKHRDWKDSSEFMHHCSTKWGSFLMSLKSLLETGHGAPSPDDVRIGDWH